LNTNKPINNNKPELQIINGNGATNSPKEDENNLPSKKL
jgi:hypothetical protein